MEGSCFFECGVVGTPLVDITNVRKGVIINSSKKRRDDLHVRRRLELSNSSHIKSHRNCVSSYTSLTHVKRHLKRKSDEMTESNIPMKRSVRQTDKDFTFDKHCIICGEACMKDERHPGRSRAFSVCMQTNAKSFKDRILNVCKGRDDVEAMTVLARVEGAVSDLAAAHARYHRSCASRFLTVRPGMKTKTEETIEKDSCENGLSLECSKSEILLTIDKFGKAIRDEVKQVILQSSVYNGTIDKKLARETASDTLLKLLEVISPKLSSNSLPALLISSIVTGTVKAQSTPLQTALGVKIRGSKKYLKLFHGFGVTCSHEEVLRFRKSAAKSVVEGSVNLPAISNAKDGLVQVVADNFDAEISSQNCIRSTHSLAMLVTQPQADDQDVHTKSFARIKKDEMTKQLDYDIPVQVYKGPKKPQLPEALVRRSVLSLQILANQCIAKQRAEEHDFRFLHDVISNLTCPEYNGFNSSLIRQLGKPSQKKTKVAYLPLIDMKPASHDTMMTAMVEAQVLTRRTGQNYVVFTCDLQLYRISLEVKWAYPYRFKDTVLRLGGMHALMSFVGSVGTLMEESGLAEIMSDVFGSVTKMLTGKKFPQNVRALRMVAEELLRPIFTTGNILSIQDLMATLDDKAKRSNTARLWIDMLIKPVFIMMMFVRAEREACWLLHLESFRMMLPYFFAAGHVNYARYGTYYLQSMEALSGDCLERFLKGEHVMRHTEGIWNGIWSDMLIETTFMRYGHSAGGVIGFTLKPETLKVWALSMHACTSLEADLEEMMTSNIESTGSPSHKENGASRIDSHGADRRAIRERMSTCIDPMETDKHPEGLINIVSGKIAKSDVNVQDAICIGTTLKTEFAEQLPTRFYETIKKKVITMKETTKAIEKKVCDTNIIYQRIIGLLASGRDVDIADVFRHELSRIPTSMFSDSGDMRISSSKSTLKTNLQVEGADGHYDEYQEDVVADGHIGGYQAAVEGTDGPIDKYQVDVVLIDGLAFLWVVRWPEEGTVEDYINNFKKEIARRLKDSDVYIVFDRYYDYSVKSVTRGGRMAGVGKEYRLHIHSKLPNQKIALTISKNKQQMIDLITADLTADVSFHECSDNHKLVLTGSDPVPVQIWRGQVTKREDLSSSYEEADNTIVHQLLVLAKVDTTIKMCVMADDTDIFVLLIHYIAKHQITNPVIMRSPIKDRKTIVDMNATVRKHSDCAGEIIALHAITGCDTVGCYYGIGKVTAMKTLKSGVSIKYLADIHTSYKRAHTEAVTFVSACYGQLNSSSMSNTRLRVWAERTGKSSGSHPNLCCLPPTSEAFEENFKRARYQAIIWSTLDEKEPPQLDPEEFGWIKDVNSRTLLPVQLPPNTKQAPDSILKLLKCGCKSDKPCSTRSCSCHNASNHCTMFCACFANGCCNAYKRDGS